VTLCLFVPGRYQLRMMVTDDMDCLSALHAVFHELQLVRIQRRPRGPPENHHPRHELLLGDIHSRTEFRNTYRPTAFQTPLLRADQVLTDFNERLQELLLSHCYSDQVKVRQHLGPQCLYLRYFSQNRQKDFREISYGCHVIGRNSNLIL
jgi:hypothetical protein